MIPFYSFSLTLSSTIFRSLHIFFFLFYSQMSTERDQGSERKRDKADKETANESTVDECDLIYIHLPCNRTQNRIKKKINDENKHN